MRTRLVHVAVLAMCLLSFAGFASAQVYTGRIDITAKDGTGAVLPGVTVDLAGVQAGNAVTDSRGEAHFLNLPPGKYTVNAKLSGFNEYKNDNVPVGAGSVVPLMVTLTVGNVAASVEVKAETPVIETKKVAVSTNITLDELQNIPTSRDPWVVLQTVPGVIIDRVNVGGAESGQQSNFQAKGARQQDNTWNMDGIAITDMAALGSSPTYYDFDMFQEMQVTTGGADVSTPTPGVGMNFVLRSGTNSYRGSARYYFENSGLQADNAPPASTGEVTSYNRIKSYFDTGFELGGPIIKDKLWAWGAYGQTEPKLKIFTLDSSVPAYLQTAKDETILKNTSLKFNGDINAATRASFTFFRGDKQKFGRSASALRPAETTLDQKGPTTMYKAEVNRTLSNSLFLTGRYAHITGGFSLTPEGGLSAPPAYRDGAGVWHNTYAFFQTNRPQDTFQVEGNSFKGKHELKFGFGWRKSSVSSDSGWPGGEWTSFSATGYPVMTAHVVRNAVYSGNGVYWNGFIGDTITMDRFTYNLGLRWDRQASSIEAASAPANPLSPLLPAITSTAVNNAVVYNSVVPRLGVTYALGNDRKTLLRATYARFADQLDSNAPFTLSLSTIPYYSYVYYRAVDANGDKIAQRSEFQEPPTAILGFDPNNPTSTPNVVGNYKTPMTDELVIGADHELMPNFGLSASYTWRRRTNQNWSHARGVTGSDYVQTSTLSGNEAPVGAFSVPIYSVLESAYPADNGTIFESRDGYHQSYKGFEITGTKRMSNNWFMRMSFSAGSNREYFDNVDAHYDLTPTLPGTSEWTLGTPGTNGGITFVPSSGSGKSNIFITLPKYQFVTTFSYQLKWGFNVGVNYLVRQGSAAPYYIGSDNEATNDLTLGSGRNVVVVNNVEDFHLPTLQSFDGRISKAFIYKNYTANLDFDCFNLFNNSTVLQRQFNLDAPNANSILEIMNPRIFRIGLRFSFR